MSGEENHDTDVQASQQGGDPLVPKGMTLWLGPAGFTYVGGFPISLCSYYYCFSMS